MKNETPSVTSTYFIELIKGYLQGHKTRKEILEETAEVLEFDSYLLIEEGIDITYLLIEAARDMNETFYLDIVSNINHSTDTVPTRAGLIHQLDAFVKGEISRQDLLEWATWYNIDDDQLSAGIFDDFTVEFFCLDFLPTYNEEITGRHFRQILQLFKMNIQQPLKEKMAIILLLDKEKQSFLFYLRNYLENQQLTETLDLYLMKKFGMDHQSFPYMQELQAISGQPEKLEALLEKALLIH
ncbi:hypothetical protein SAMN05518672_104212 [Chitinophaga sp. CF118]|uniref:hypothetical protein n=1 Tax=Chitinophaga sp. CF118 TaxID=1884367 RepID=UPI0008F1503C|nr:hypothetical protein [Chitinophaga sp. CF118]SFE03451.1 hypothetical protein SAMN05518672_104212 [Chitinophaga sp. CF118]